MKLRWTLALILSAVMCGALALFAAGCSGNNSGYDVSTWDGPVVTFVLNENTELADADLAKYKNSTDPVIHFYKKLDEGQTVRIHDPYTYSGADVELSFPGHVLAGWYRQRTQTSSGYEYSDPWDFENDVISQNTQITLYAKWDKKIRHSFNVCYRDENGEKVILGTYYQGVDKGSKFKDSSNFAELMKNYGKTALPGYYDENDEPWDDNFSHPGGDKDVAVDVYVHWIDGVYNMVSTAEEFIAAQNSGVYLLDDIDLEGAEFGGFRDVQRYDTYSSDFKGNGKTVKNIKLTYDATKNGLVNESELGESVLLISLFANLYGAKVEDVTFENVTVDINASFSSIKQIYVVPISPRLYTRSSVLDGTKTSAIKNVQFTGTYTITQLPRAIEADRSKLHIATDSLYYTKDANAEVSGNNAVSFTETPVQTAALPLKVTLYNKSKKEFDRNEI